MTDNELGKLIDDSVDEKDGRKKLSCAAAFVIAGNFGVSLSEISRYCNQNEIKISNCQLGCFK